MRDVPTYTVPEAAAFLAIPVRTMQYWVSGPRPALTPAGKVGGISLLSFKDVSEAYVLDLLRRFYGFSIACIHDIAENAKRETKLKRPLIEAELKVVLNNLVIERPAKGRQPRRCVDLAHHRNLVIPGLVDMLGKRILKDAKNSPYRLHPWRLLSFEDQSEPITVDPQIMSGRAVLTGTRIPLSIVVGMYRSGKTPDQIGSSYSLDPELIRKAIQHGERTVLKVA